MLTHSTEANTHTYIYIYVYVMSVLGKTSSLPELIFFLGRKKLDLNEIKSHVNARY